MLTLPFPPILRPLTRPTLALVLGVACGACAADGGGGGSDPADAAPRADQGAAGPKRTFFAESDGNLGGPAGADTLCQGADANPDPAATWKALIAAPTRVACTTPDCVNGTAGQVDWVLRPNQAYLRPDGAPGFTTDANAVVTAYPLPDGLLDEGYNFWSGLDNDWTLYADFHCQGWTSAAEALQGRVGWTQTVDDGGWIQGGAIDCDIVQRVLCVEQ